MAGVFHIVKPRALQRAIATPMDRRGQRGQHSPVLGKEEDVRASAARLVAAGWVADELRPSLDPAGFVGAYVMGSLAAAADDDEFDIEARDIDIAIVVDPDRVQIDHEHYPHGRFVVHDGCALQAILLSREIFDSEERLLGMLGLGSNLRCGHVLVDPTGLIAAAQATVVERWHGPSWVRHRLGRAIDFAEGALRQVEHQQAALGRLIALTELITQLAGVVAISRAVTPTHRRALVLARQLLADEGRPDLHDGLLAAIGAGEADEAAVGSAIDDGVEALQIELRYPPMRPDLSEEFRARLPSLFVAGVREVVQDGYPREAMLPALSGLLVSAMTVGDRASPDDRQRLDELLDRRLRAAGIGGEAAWGERVQAARALTDEISRLCMAKLGS